MAGLPSGAVYLGGAGAVSFSYDVVDQTGFVYAVRQPADAVTPVIEVAWLQIQPAATVTYLTTWDSLGWIEVECGGALLLYSSDGSEAGTQLLARLSGSPQSNSAWILGSLGGRLLLAAETDDTLEIFGADTTGSATLILEQAWDPSSSASATVATFGDVGGRVVFAITSADTVSVYGSDGTASGTETLTQLSWTSTSTVGGVARSFGWIDGHMLFWVGDGDTLGVYGSDGSAAGTQRLAQFPGQTTIVTLATLGQAAIFVANVPGGGALVYSTDGAGSGTRLLETLASGAVVTSLGAVGQRALFLASDPRGGAWIYGTDGTLAGTASLELFSGGATANCVGLVGGRMVLLADTASGAVLYGVDGTAAGSQILGTFAIGATVSTLGTPQAGAVLLEARSGGDTVVYGTDGTSAGTRLLIDAGSGSVQVIFSGSGRDPWLFTVTTGALVTLYATDGTTAATVATYSPGSSVTVVSDSGKDDVGVTPAGAATRRFWVNEATGAVSAAGDEYLWTGPISGGWSAASDWTNETASANPAPTAPGANDSVTIGTSSDAATQAVAGTGAAAYLTIAGPTALEGLFVAGALSATAALTVGSGDALTVSGAATLAATGDALTVDGSLTAASMVMNGGVYTVETGGTLSVSANVTTTEANAWSTIAVSGGRFTVGGTLYSDGATADSSLSATADAEVRLGGLCYGQTSAGTDSPLLTGVGLATDATSSIEIGSAGGAAAGAITIDSGVTVDEFGTFAAANVIDNGVIAVTPDRTLTLSGTGAGGLAGNGEVAIVAGSTLIVTGFPNSSAAVTIAFDGDGGALSLAPSDLVRGAFSPRIIGFDGGDSIVFQGVVTAAAYASGVLTLLDGASTVAQLALSAPLSTQFSTVELPSGATQINLRSGGDTTTGPAGTAGADAYLWTGPASGSWDAASNWTDETANQNPAPAAPGANDAVTIAASGAATQAVTGTGAAACLTIAGPTALEGRFVAGTLTATAALTVGSGDVVTVSGAATLAATGDALSVEGSLTAASMVMNGGAYTVESGGTLSVSGNVTTTEANAWSTIAVSGGRFTVLGTLYSDAAASGSSLSASANGVIRLGGLIHGQTSDGTGSPLLTGVGLAADATSSIEIGSAGGAARGAITIDSGVTVDEFGTFAAANVIANGVIAVTPGQTLTLSGTSAGGLAGNGVVAIGAGSTLIVTGFPNSSAAVTIAFDGEGGTLSIEPGDFAGGAFSPRITGFDGSDCIVVQGVVTSAAYASGVLTLLDGGSAVAQLTLPGGFAPNGFAVTADDDGTSRITLARNTAPPLTVTFAGLSFDGGGLSGGQPTTGDPVIFRGTVAGAQPLARVEVYDGAQDLGAATVTGGAWSLTATLDAGPHAGFTAIAVDLAGNSAAASFTQAVDVAPLPVDVSQTTPYTLSASQADFIFGPSTNIAVSSSGSIAAVSGALGVVAGWNVTNEGFLSAAGGPYPPAGVMFDSDASVTNAKGATITGGSFGVDIFGAGSVVNSGAISGPTAIGAAGGEGVSMSLGGSVTNNSGAIISGARIGVAISGAAASVTNAGSIGGGLASIVFSGAFADTLSIAPGSTLSGDVVVAGGASLTVTGLAAGAFVIANGASIAFATPDGFGPGDAVDFQGVPYASGDVVVVAGVGANQTVEVVSAAGVEAAAFAAQGNEAAAHFVVGPDGSGGLDVVRAATIADFLAGQSRLDAIAGGFAVSDAAATLAAYLTASVPAGPSALALDAARITAITASDGKPVTVGGGVFAADQAALDKIGGGFSLSGQASVLNGLLAGLEADQSRINAVAARNPQGQIVGLTATIAQFAADAQILNKSTGGFAISDAAATIAAYLTASVPAGPSALALDAAAVAAITAADGNPVTVGGGVFAADQAALDKIVGGFSLSGQASVLNGLLAGLEADQSRINAVAARNPQGQIVGLTATMAQFGADEPILNKSTGGFGVTDTAATIAAYLTASVPAGPSALALDAAAIGAITASDGSPVTVGGGVFAADRAALDKIGGGFSLSGQAGVLNGLLAGLEADQSRINAVAARNPQGQIVGLTATMAEFGVDEPILNKSTGGFGVTDTAANVAAGLDLLQADVAAIVSITLTDTTRPTLTLTAAQAAADHAVLARIATPYTLTLV